MSLLIYHPSLPTKQNQQGGLSTAAVTLDAAASRHVQVLRKQPNDTVTLFNGRGTVHTATIQGMGRKNVTVAIHSTQHQAPPTMQLTLLTGLIAGSRMDWLIEKATELGATHIQPVLLQRSVVRLPALVKNSGNSHSNNGNDCDENNNEHARSAKKRKQWEQLAIAACEQSGRAWLPIIAPVRTLDQAVQTLQTAHMPHKTGAGTDMDTNRAAHTEGNATEDNTSVTNAPHQALQTAAPVRCLLSLHPDSQPIGHIVTPNNRHIVFASAGEGGFSEEEETLLVEKGYTRTSLGNTVLRAETAPIAAICMAHALSARR